MHWYGSMMDDVALVGLALSQPQQGFAAIYDRYGTSLYNYCHSILRSEADAGDALQDSFVAVMDKLGQLRDADKLRPWLYAIARNECFKRHRARKRERPEDPFETDEEQTVMAAPADQAPGAELVSMVWEATAGLSEVDRSVLELNIRHELDGEALASSLGVPGPKCSVMLHRAKERLRTAVGALIVSKVGAEVCGDLSGIVGGNEFSPLIRKRVARHITSCAVCEETERRHRPEAYLAVVPLLRIPVDVHKRVIDTIHTATAGGAASAAGGAGRGDGVDPGGAGAAPQPVALGVGGVDRTRWDEAGFPIPPSERVRAGAGREGVPSRLGIAAVVIGCVVALVALLALLNPFDDRTTVVAGAAQSLEPTALPRPVFEPTEPPAPPTSTSTADPEATGRTQNPVASAPTATPTVTVVPVATTAGSAPATATVTAPSPIATPTTTPTPTPTPTASPTPTATPTPPAPTPTSTPPGPTPTGSPPLTPPGGQPAPTSGEIFVDFTAPSVSPLTVDCGDPFVLRVTVADAGDPDPTVDLEATWDDESDAPIPLTRQSGNTYRAEVPRAELNNEHIDFFVRGFVQDASGNTRLVDLDDDCTIIG